MRRKWDSLDIVGLVEAALEGFAQEFYGYAWDEMNDKDAARVLRSLSGHVGDLAEAQAPTTTRSKGAGRHARQPH